MAPRPVSSVAAGAPALGLLPGLTSHTRTTPSGAAVASPPPQVLRLSRSTLPALGSVSVATSFCAAASTRHTVWG